MKFTGERIVPKDKICGPETEIYKEHLVRYEFACKFIKKSDAVLDLACGVGYGTQMIAKSTSGQVYGCDASKETIDYAKQNYMTKNITFKIMDAISLSFPEKYFDIIVCFETIEHVENYEKTLMEFSRVLKENGTLIISSPNKEVSLQHESNNKFHVNEFTRDELLKIISKYFHKTKLYSQKLIVEPSFKEKAIKSALSLGFKLAKHDRINLRRKLIKEGTGEQLYHSVDDSYREPKIIPYESSHTPQNFVVVCTGVKDM